MGGAHAAGPHCRSRQSERGALPSACGGSRPDATTVPAQAEFLMRQRHAAATYYTSPRRFRAHGPHCTIPSATVLDFVSRAFAKSHGPP